MITRIYSVQHKLLVSLFVSIQLLTRSMQRTIEQLSHSSKSDLLNLSSEEAV